MTFSGSRPLLASVTFALGAILLAACQGGNGQGVPAAQSSSGAASPRTDVTASPGATAMDGSTIRAAGDQNCDSPGTERIRQVLGALAEQVKSGVAVLSESSGVRKLTCTFSLAPVPPGQDPDPGNSLTVSTETYPDPTSAANVKLPRLMMSPQTATDGRGPAWFARNQLTSTTEYVLESVSANVITRLTLAVPVQTPAVDQPLEKLRALLDGH